MTKALQSAERAALHAARLPRAKKLPLHNARTEPVKF